MGAKKFDVKKYFLSKTFQVETSPPSAQEAAMSAMQHEIFLKHLESFLETSLKHPGITLENGKRYLPAPLGVAANKDFYLSTQKISNAVLEYFP